MTERETTAERESTSVEVSIVDDHRVAKLRALARVMDSAIRIPGTQFRIGMDALVGMIPGLGDVIGALVSGYIVVESARIGASRGTLMRMLANIGIEALVGAVPALGDLFDAAYRANDRNVRLLEEHVEEPGALTRRSRMMIVGIGVGVFAVGAALVAFSVWALITGLRILGGG